MQLTLEMEANSISSSSTIHTFQSPSTMQRSINRQQSDDDFYSLDGRSQGDSHYEVNTHILNSQVFFSFIADITGLKGLEA